MVCPTCQSSLVIVQNNKFVCSKCGTQIGEATSAADYAVPSQIANVSTQPSPQVGANLNQDKNIIQDKKIVDYKGRFLGLAKSLAVFIVFGLIVFWVNTIGSYVDLMYGCRIEIPTESERGNTKTIYKALENLKREDSEAYSMVCKYVDTIGEQQCPISDTRTGGQSGGTVEHSDNCYVKGSKAIYLFPRSDNTTDSINDRALEIKNLAGLSQKFWQDR